MHHTSGITDFLSVTDRTTNFGTKPITNSDILEFVRTSPAAREGRIASFDYSNTSYNLLADIVTEVTGTKFTEVDAGKRLRVARSRDALLARRGF